MARRLRLLTAFLAIASLLVAADKPTALTPDQKRLNVESFDYVWKTIRDQHWDPKLGGLDWPAVRDEFRPKVEQAGNMPEVRAVLSGMIARLRQSHFNIVPAEVYKDLDDKTAKDPDDGSTGLQLRVLGGQALVTAVEEGSPAAAQSVRPGWQIVKIDGADLALAFEKIAEAYKESTLREVMLMRAVTSKLAGKAGQTVRIEFRDGGDRPIELTLTRGKPKGARFRIGYLPPMYVWMESRRLEGNIGYIVFNAFLDPPHLMKTFEDAVRSCLRCDGIIIDLRGNPGGIGGMAMGMAGWFIDGADQRLGTMYLRQTPLKFVVNPRVETYRGPLAILVDGCSGSTSEIFAGGMKDLGRARIFGTRTAAAALPSVFERLPNGDGFQYAIANYISEGGKPLEGNGVVPDVEVKLTREALLAGRDPVLDAASQWIRKSKETP